MGLDLQSLQIFRAETLSCLHGTVNCWQAVPPGTACGISSRKDCSVMLWLVLPQEWRKLMCTEILIPKGFKLFSRRKHLFRDAQKCQGINQEQQYRKGKTWVLKTALQQIGRMGNYFSTFMKSLQKQHSPLVLQQGISVALDGALNSSKSVEILLFSSVNCGLAPY